MAAAVTIASALAAGRQQIPPLEARQLLEVVINRPTAWLVTHDDEPLTAEQRARYQSFLDRAAAGEPIPYITGRIWFYGRPFMVTPDVLIPRPETEELVGRCLTALSTLEQPHIVDVGTGSGCIAVTVGCETPQKHTTVSAVDRSAAALAVARKNWRQLAPTNPLATLKFLASDLLNDINTSIDVLVANLPYVTDQEFAELPASVRDFEPHTALRGGAEGLDLIEPLLEQAVDRMAPNGVILLEIGWRQGSAAVDLARSIFPQAVVACLKDLAGHDRIIEVKLQYPPIF